MKQKSSSKVVKRKLLWSFAATIVLIAVLLYFEQIAVIYVLATLGLVALLLMVTLADLEKLDKPDSETTVQNAPMPSEQRNQPQTETEAAQEGGQIK